MKKIMLISAILLIAATLTAHEFWLQPKPYWFKVNDKANITFNVGENFDGQNWAGSKNKIQQLFCYTPSAQKINISNLLFDNKGDSLLLPLNEEGTHMVIFNSTNSFINLTPEKFNNYLKDDGLQTAIIYRKEHNEENINGKEYYQRSVKTLLQAGFNNFSKQVTVPTSLPLDIVPSKNPYDNVMNDERIRFTFLFKGKPLQNQLVKVWRKQNGKTSMKELMTDEKGMIKYFIEKQSVQWMISTVVMERSTIDTTANWQSYWGSLTFGNQGNFFAKRR